MYETEIEILVEDFFKVRNGLLKNKFPVERLRYRDIYFGLDFFKRGERIRLRTIKDSKGNEKYLLTKKSPMIDKFGIQRAEERENFVESFRKTYDELVLKYGPVYFDEELKVETYLVEGIILQLREIIGLFKYIEIEGDESKVEMLSEEIKGKIIKEGAFKKVCKMRGINL